MVQERSSQPIGSVRGIVSSRALPVTRDEVFQAFSDPARLAQWWGPQGFTNDFQQFDFRPRGAWKFTLRGPDGTVHAMDQQFVEIVRPERIVMRHIQPGHDFTLIMTYLAREGRTELVWVMRFDDPAEGERVRAFVLPANEQNFDRLAAHLTRTTQSP